MSFQLLFSSEWNTPNAQMDIIVLTYTATRRHANFQAHGDTQTRLLFHSPDGCQLIGDWWGVEQREKDKARQKETDRQKEKVRDEYWAACGVINADTDGLTDTYRLFHQTSSSPLTLLSGLAGLCLHLSHLGCLIFHMPNLLIACLSGRVHVHLGGLCPICA